MFDLKNRIEKFDVDNGTSVEDIAQFKKTVLKYTRFLEEQNSSLFGRVESYENRFEEGDVIKDKFDGIIAKLKSEIEDLEYDIEELESKNEELGDMVYSLKEVGNEAKYEGFDRRIILDSDIEEVKRLLNDLFWKHGSNSVIELLKKALEE